MTITICCRVCSPRRGHPGLRGARSTLLALALAALPAVPSHAGEAQPRLSLQTGAEQEVRVQREGQWVTERVPLAESNPGDVIVYTISYANNGSEPVTGASIVDPIPEGTAYVVGSAAGADTVITYSVDAGGSFREPPIRIQFRGEDGSLESRPAPPEAYTHIRWEIANPVLPGESGSVSLKVTVR